MARRLFVHEYRCIAAPAEGRAAQNASLNQKTKVRRHGNDRTCLDPLKPLCVLRSEFWRRICWISGVSARLEREGFGEGQ